MQLYYEALLELILKKEERRGDSYIHVCEEAEIDQAGMSINHQELEILMSVIKKMLDCMKLHNNFNRLYLRVQRNQNTMRLKILET